MWIRSIVIGLFSAAVAMLPFGLWKHFPEFFQLLPFLVLGIGGYSFFFRRWIWSRNSGQTNPFYKGMSNLFLHIHLPPQIDASLRWLVRGGQSLLWNLLGAGVGPEGAAVEFTQAASVSTRSHSSRWFEQQRRSDAACALAAAISATFQAPFAAIILPVEFRMGGNVLSSLISSLSAFLCARYFQSEGWVSLPDFGKMLVPFEFNSFLDWGQALSVIFLILVIGIASVFFIRLVPQSSKSFRELFRNRPEFSFFLAAAMVFLVLIAFRDAHAPPAVIFENLLSLRLSIEEGMLHLLALSMVTILILSVYGSMGVFWPVLLIGGLVGFGVGQFFPDFLALCMIAGGAAMWASVFGAPLAGTIFIFELTQNIDLFLPSLVVCLGAQQVRKLTKTKSLLDQDLEESGIELENGRILAILESLSVSDAMVKDHETVRDHDTIDQIFTTLIQSQYPFLPVVDRRGNYVGLLTADVIEKAWKEYNETKPGEQEVETGEERDESEENDEKDEKETGLLLEAKDLLYHSGVTVPHVLTKDKLSAATGLFRSIPVVPVVDEKKKIAGLLFSHNVRIAYEEEVARQSFYYYS